jgi:DNA-binding HxlR family transcriptional regulator
VEIYYPPVHQVLAAQPPKPPANNPAGRVDAARVSAAALLMAQSWMGTLSGKWSLPILERLAKRPARYNVLLAELEPVTPKVLTQSLRRLEREALVRHQRVGRIGRSYELTGRGRRVLEGVAPLRELAGREALADWLHADARRGINPRLP